MKRLLSLLTFALLVGVAGCGPKATVVTPEGFAPLEDQEAYAYRAIDANGVVLAVRVERNEPKGNLSFWTGLVDNHLRRRSYVRKNAEGGEALTSASGVPGRKLVYERNTDGRNYGFWAAVFVTDDRVYVVEAGGDEAFLNDAMRATIEKTLPTVSF